MDRPERNPKRGRKVISNLKNLQGKLKKIFSPERVD